MKSKSFVHPEVSKHYSRIGKLGGEAVKRKYGAEYYHRMIRKRWADENEQIQLAISNKSKFIKKDEFRLLPINLEEVED